jgi:hypothetical protein
MLRKNKDYCLPVKDVVAKYVAKHHSSRRRGIAAAAPPAPAPSSVIDLTRPGE